MLCGKNKKIFEILSFSNPRIKEVVKLKNKSKRDEKKLFLIEGYREILRAFKSGVRFKNLFFAEEFFLKGNEKFLIEEIKNREVEIFKCSKKVFEKISYKDRPDGLLAVAFQFNLKIEDLKIEDLKSFKNPFLVVCESIEKPGNLGSILRSADGAGVDALFICDPVTDIFNPNVVRASIGTLFTKPVIVCKKEEVFSYFKENNIKIVATTPNSDKIYTKENLKTPLAIIVGSEQYGLSNFWLKKADVKVKIPMRGDADSLNVSAATTILLYEVQRQRNFIH
jgi:TrmH family RNA methyltransferase